MGESGGLAGHAAQAEARAGVEVGGLQAAVVEPERLGDAILEVELAIVVAGQMLCGERGGLGGIEAIAVEEVARVDRSSSCGWSAGPPSSTKRRSQ